MCASWVAAMGLHIGVPAKADDQVILFSALGGTWFPLEAANAAFAAIGKAMLSTWAMNGYQNILIRELGLESACMPALMLLADAVGFFGLAVWRFRKMDV